MHDFTESSLAHFFFISQEVGGEGERDKILEGIPPPLHFHGAATAHTLALALKFNGRNRHCGFVVRL